MSRSLPGDGFTKRARVGTLRGMSEATQSTIPRRTWSRRTVALAAVAALILALIGIRLAVVAARRAVSIEQNGVAPAGEARGNVPVRVRFSREMDRASAEARFRIAPDVPGEFTWSDDRTLVFTPQRALPAGQTYTVTIDSGAAARNGATLDGPFTWQFAVLPPRVVYLAPASELRQQLVLADPATGAAEPLTSTDEGVLDYAVSPNGRLIAYAQEADDHSADLWVLDLLSGERWPITDCVGAVCHNPAWSPDSRQIAYERAELDPERGTGTGASRAWIVDLATLQPRLMFEDEQVLGANPVWSPDGARVAAFDATIPGVRVRDLDGGPGAQIESLEGAAGIFSPDGARLLIPVLVRGALGEAFYTQLDLVDFARGERTRVSGEEDAPVEDAGAVWLPDGDTLIVLRRYLDDRFTQGRQIYRLDLVSGEAEPLVVDAEYAHSAISLDPSGTRLVYQRFPIGQPDAQPEIWTLDLSTGERALVASDAFLPAWAP